MSLIEPLVPLRDFVVQLSDHSFPVLDLFHACCVAMAHRKLGGTDIPWPQAFVSFILAACGGTLITNVFILTQPAPWMTNDKVLPLYVVVFILIRWCSPFVKFVSIPAVAWCIGVVDGISWGTSITTRGVERALIAEHTRAQSSMITSLCCGLFSGCGGGLLHSAFCLTDKNWRFQCPAGLASTVPSFAVRASGILALLYYVATNPHAILPFDALLSKDNAKFLVILTLFCLDSLAVPETVRRYTSYGSLQSVLASKEKKKATNADKKAKRH